jgi:hypothetical protein
MACPSRAGADDDHDVAPAGWLRTHGAKIRGAVPGSRRYAVDSNARTALAPDPGDPVPHRVVGARMSASVVGVPPEGADPSPAGIAPAIAGAS